MNPDDFWAKVDIALEQIRSEGFGVKHIDDKIGTIDTQHMFNTVQNARPAVWPMYNNP